MKHRDYLSFLVRVWRVNSQEYWSPEEERDTSKQEFEWRASIEYSLDSARINFGNLESLFEYIRMLTIQSINDIDKDEPLLDDTERMPDSRVNPDRMPGQFTK